MGQAKRRGTKEERVERAQEIRRRKNEAYHALQREKQRREDARIDAMTDEERAAYYAPRPRRSMMPFALMGMALMASMDTHRR
jgi:transcription elongation GreA/GreB family factor